MTKRRKTEEENADPNVAAAAGGDGMGEVEKRPRLSLSPEQRDRMAGNKLAAQVGHLHLPIFSNFSSDGTNFSLFEVACLKIFATNF